MPPHAPYNAPRATDDGAPPFEAFQIGGAGLALVSEIFEALRIGGRKKETLKLLQWRL
jgi:hypothetical protein